ncbi:MAG: hypothetical protein ACOYT8_02565 [Candidatus Dependentiae bacterium]
MIDTVVILLRKDQFTLTDPELFSPSAQWVLQPYTNQSHGIQSKQNPTKREFALGIYKPCLTLAHRINPLGGSTVSLKIELSLPKLMFGNNFQELRAKDFAALTHKLAQVLANMGIHTTPATLAKAPLSAIHYSKNIPLTDGSTPYHYINKIKEANTKLTLDVNQTDYRNEGHSYKWHCNSYEVVFYDKIKDLEKAQASSKRALEKDNELQLNFLDRFNNRNKLEILRMEVRLNKRHKIKQLFKVLHIPSDLSFKSLFKPTISKKVLLHYLDEIERARLAILDYKAPILLRQGYEGQVDKALLASLIINNPELSPKQILITYGLSKALDVVNIRELRALFAKCNQRSWYRLIKDVQKVKIVGTQSPFETVRECLKKFKPINLKHFAY